MVQSVIVDGVGTLQFPDGMSQPDMASAIQKNFPQIHKPDSVASLPTKSQRPELFQKSDFDVTGNLDKLGQRAGTYAQEFATKHGASPELAGAAGAAGETAVQAIPIFMGGNPVKPTAEFVENIPSMAKKGFEAIKSAPKTISDVYHNAFYSKADESAGKVRDVIGSHAETSAQKLREQAKAAWDKKTAAENSATSEAETLGKVHGVSTEQLNKAVGARKIAQMQHEQHATSLAKEHVSDEAAGSSFQKSGLAKQDSLAKQRQIKAIDQEKTPAYDDARTRAKNGDTLDTNPNSQVFIEQAKAQLKQAMEDLPEGFGTDIQKKLNALSGGELKELSYEEKLKNEMDRLQGKQPKQPAKESDGLTLQQGEFFRRLGHDARFREAEGFGALNAQIMKSFGDSMREAIIAYDKRMGNYIDNYRTISQEMEGSLGGRKGEGAIEVAAGKEAKTIFEKNPVEVAKQYLDGTKDSAEKLVRLVGEDKAKLSETVRGNLRAKIEHMNPAQAEKFLADNKGLLEVFPEARAPMEKLVRSKSEVDKYHEIEKAERDRVKKSADEAKKAKEKIEASGKKEAGEAEKFKSEAFKYQRDVEDISSITDKSKIATKARGIVKELRDKQEISIEKFNELNEQIDKTESLYKNSSRYKALIKGVVYASGAYKLYHIAGSL